MDNVAETIQESRKEWVTPELKKVDLEQITANTINLGDDSPSPGGS
jgi:hypothetical protein